MTVVWIQPTVQGAAQFAKWDGAIFGLVREMADGRWRAGMFPDGDSSYSMDALAGSEAQAKRWLEKWAKHHHGAIKAPKHRMPSERK